MPENIINKISSDELYGTTLVDNNCIELKDLSMQFKNTKALSNVSLCFQANKIYGLLGRNGAGKTTMLNIISNRLIPTHGAVYIDGEPAFENDKVLSKVFYVGEKQLFGEEYKVKDYFAAASRFYNFDADYAIRLAAAFKLDLKKKLKGLSTGYNTIAKLIVALSSDAKYLLLDEPVLGLDANHRELFYKELLTNYAKKPRTIILSTHLIEEISGLVEHVVVIKQGQLLLDTSAEEMLAMGYSVSGKGTDVDAYCADKQVLSMDVLGGLKSASILGKPKNVSPKLTCAALDMQKLFIHLTND